MEKQKGRRISLIIQGIYTLLCCVFFVLCHRVMQNYTREAADFLIGFMGQLFFVGCPLAFICFGLNVGFLPLKGEENRNLWMMWIFLSPVLYFCFFMAVCVIGIRTTGF